MMGLGLAISVCGMAGDAMLSRLPEMTAGLRQGPKLGLGMAALGRPGYINLGHADHLPEERTVEAMRAHAHEILDEAVSLGIRYIDCARSYGLSEEFVSTWLASRPAEVGASLTLGSKWGYEYTAGWRVQVGDGEAHEVKKHTLEQLEKQAAETAALLPGLSLYQIHSTTEESGVLENEPVLAAIAALRDGALTAAPGAKWAPGLSVSSPQLPAIERAVALQQGGAPLFASVQATFNVFDQSAAGALRAAHEAGIVVIIKEAMANGRVLESELLRTEAQRLGTSVDALALAWVMSHDWVDICLSGAATVDHLRSNAEALKLVPLPADVQTRLAEGLRQDPEEYWAERKCLAWT